MKKEITIHNQRLAGKLMADGFVLKRMEKTTSDNSNRNVFIFNESENLLLSIKQYKLTN